jgi:hypothetical protein
MDVSSILGVVTGLLMVAGLYVALRSRSKRGPEKVEELRLHLQSIGVDSSVVVPAVAGNTRGRRFWTERSVGVVKPVGRTVDSIDVVGVAIQQGVKYFLEYLVRNTGSAAPGGKRKRKARMAKKTTSSAAGSQVDIEWKGDDSLVRRLNLDYRLRDMLLKSRAHDISGGIRIFLEPQREYSRIKMAFVLPSSDLLDAVDIIARHVRSA